jgi:hypothetical protein
MSVCWAASLGDCAGKISREHIVTKGVFVDREVFVHGFDWCRDAPVKIGLAGLTAKILCAKHNSDLSGADDAAIGTVEQFREFFRLADVRCKLKPRRWRIIRFSTNGFELERWFLKTLTNIAFGREYPVFKPTKQEWRPSQELVEIAFGRKRFQPRAGLYLIGGEAGDNVDANEKFRIITFTDSSDRLTGARFLIFGFTFVIYLDEKGLDRQIYFCDVGGRAAPGTNVFYHPRAIRFTTRPDQPLSHVLEIDWQ